MLFHASKHATGRVAPRYSLLFAGSVLSNLPLIVLFVFYRQPPAI
jgi:ABC-type glycerol-3-phosphate transport system permease component